jgi:hypothetical protein
MLIALLRRLAARLRPPNHRPTVVHRMALHCPHGGRLVEVDLLMGPTGMPERVVRCSTQRENPPACEQACRTLHEALAGPVDTLLILPPGHQIPDEID